MRAHVKTETAAANLTPTGDAWLLTPGPLTTSPTVKQAMLHDFGSRDPAFIELNAAIRRQLVEIINGDPAYECVPLQGSGTFIVEAMIGSFVPADGKALILVNGAYGTRMVKICAYIGRQTEIREWPEDQPVDPAVVADLLAADPMITHVLAVHCETTSGILNPLAEISAVVAAAGRGLLIDAMSCFGAIEIDAEQLTFDAVVASSNKCLEGVPGIGFCLADRSALIAAKGNAPSLSLDLYDQWANMEKNGQWRFTPPTHAALALAQALSEHEGEGGVAGRGRRYRENCDILTAGMRRLGFETLLDDALQAPIIVTFKMPADPAFDFQQFYDALKAKGFVVYPGKLTVADSFRIGCIGRLDKQEINAALAAVETTMAELGVASGAPPAA